MTNNQEKQKTTTTNRSTRRSRNARRQHRSSPERSVTHKSRKDTKHRSSRNKNEDVRGSAEGKCPVHPHGSHTWAECRQNAANVNKQPKTHPTDERKPKSFPAKKNGKANKDVDGKAMMLEDDLSLASRSTLSSDRSTRTSSSDSSRDDRAMNDDDDTSIENHVAETGEAIENLTLDDPIPKKTKKTRESPENGKSSAFLSLSMISLIITLTPSHFHRKVILSQTMIVK